MIYSLIFKKETMNKFTFYRYLILLTLLFPAFIAYAHSSKSDTTIYVAAEKMPAYPGGAMARNTFIAKHIQYPGEAVKDHVSGTVYVAFVVEQDGSLSHIKVLKGIGHGCDKEAMKIVAEMPKWTPGTIKGKPVRVRFTLPFSFNLQPNNKVFTHADEYPVFDYPGGLKSYLNTNKLYPAGIIKNKKIDTVKVFFVVNPDKRITQVTIKKDSGALNACDYEAMRLVKNIKVAKPAYVQHRRVSLRLYLPLVFDYRKIDTIGSHTIESVYDGKSFYYYPPNQVFVVVDHMPTFPGGEQALMQYLAVHIHYPEQAKKLHQQGRVFLHFIVEGDGTITHIKVLRGISPSLDSEAVKVIENMPKWNPGTQRGKPVRVSFNLPIMFTLE